MKSAKTLFGFMLFTALFLGAGNSMVYAQTEKSEKAKATKKVSGFKKDLKKIAKILSFKRNIKHHDSVKLARRYIHEQHKLTRKRDNYPYKLNKGALAAAKNKVTMKDDFELAQEVLGWYPFWEKDLYKDIDYKLLSTIAYFSYEVNPKNGEAESIHEWKTTPLIDTAIAKGKKVLLTVTNFGNSNNKKLLNSKKSTATLVKNLVQLISSRGAHGVCIDFEGVHKSERNKFSAFISQLKQQLQAADSSYEVYITLPAVDWQEYLDFDTIIPFVDRFVIMGYDYYGQSSKVAGPIAPLESGQTWEPYNLEVSVDFYLAHGIPNKKLMLALPYYGYIWETDTGKKAAKARKFIGSRTYDYIKANVTSPIKYDSISKSAWSAYSVQDSKVAFRQVWFDDFKTFSIKLDYLKKKKLKGLGIWALGYNHVNKDLWNAVATELEKTPANNPDNPSNPSDPDDPSNPNNGGDPSNPGNDPADSNDDPSDPNKNTANGNNIKKPTTSKKTSFDQILKKLTDIEAILKDVTDHKTVLMLIMLLVVIFGGVGFVIGMFSPNTRAYFFTNTAQTVVYCLVVLCSLVVLLRWNHTIKDPTVILIIGFILGAISGYLIHKILEQKDKEKP